MLKTVKCFCCSSSTGVTSQLFIKMSCLHGICSYTTFLRYQLQTKSEQWKKTRLSDFKESPRKTFLLTSSEYLEIKSSAEPSKWMIAALRDTAAARTVPKSPVSPFDFTKKSARIVCLNKSDFSEYLFLSFLHRMLWGDEDILSVNTHWVIAAYWKLMPSKSLISYVCSKLMT